MGKYLFGDRFTDFQGVTDPELQRRLVEAEAMFGPQYQKLDLQGMEDLLWGIQGPRIAPGQTQDLLAREQQAWQMIDSGDPAKQEQGSAMLKQVEDERNWWNTFGGQRGVMDMLPELTTGYQGAMSDGASIQRERDVADVEALGNRAHEAFMAANPQLAGALSRIEELGTRTAGQTYQPVQPATVGMRQAPAAAQIESALRNLIGG